MKKITQREVAKQVGIESDYFNHILRRRCNCPPKLAPKLEQATSIDRTIWVWGSKKQLHDAWNKFSRGEV